MSALAKSRNTIEMRTGAQQINRVKTITDGVTLYLGAIGAIAGSTGNAVTAADVAGQIVLGVITKIDTDTNLVSFQSGMFGFDNGSSGEALDAADLQKVVYVVDDHTVGAVGGSNNVKAGVLRDIDAAGICWVEVGNIRVV